MIDTVVVTDNPAEGGQIVLSGPGLTRRYEGIPAGMLTDLPWLLTQVVQTCEGQPVATLITPSAASTLTPRISGGWQTIGLELDSGWYTLVRTSGPQPRRVQLCVLDRIGARNRLFAPGWPADRITDNLRRYRDLVGTPWYATAGVTGCGLMRSLGDQMVHRPQWIARAGLPERIPPALDLHWRREYQRPLCGDTPESAPLPRAHRWDVRGAYLAAAAQVCLGGESPEWGGPAEFDAHRAGWWLVAEAAARGCLDPHGPPLWDHTASEPIPAGRGVWLSTPMIDYLLRDGFPLTAHATFLSPPGHRYLRPWAQQLRDARYTAVGERLDRSHPVLWAALKGTYAEGVGMLGRPGGRVYRPDWRALVIDYARTALHRKVSQIRRLTGQWPVRIDVDSVWYPLPVDAPELSDPKPYIGQFRYEGVEQLAPLPPPPPPPADERLVTASDRDRGHCQYHPDDQICPACTSDSSRRR
jgi:hypothetical protein